MFSVTPPDKLSRILPETKLAKILMRGVEFGTAARTIKISTIIYREQPRKLLTNCRNLLMYRVKS